MLGSSSYFPKHANLGFYVYFWAFLAERRRGLGARIS